MKPLDALTPHWPEISRVLDQALDQPLALRQAWLTDQRTLAPAVRDVVRQLLSQRAAVETDDFLATLPPLQLAPQPAGEAPTADDRVGPWRLLRELGQGGMGSVWLAERTDGSLKRRVALKLPRLSWARGLAERLARERDILATLEHPHIARLYDAGVDELGRPWLALEHVQGRAIDTYCREEALSVPRRVELVLQVCAAVAYAHSRLVIHRDLKPGNILVGDDGQVRLLDFGIAKLLDGDRASETALTLAAGRVLTLDYASPEQVRGEPLSTASDVYSLGVVAYELLAGVRPYKLKRGSAAELEEAIANTEPTLASTAATTPADRAALRGGLDAVLQQALAKQASTRYPTVDALAQDLGRHLAGQAVAARALGRVYRLRRWAWQRRLPLGLAAGLGLALLGGAHAQAAVMLALAAGVLVALWQRREALRQADKARAESQEARRQSERAEAEVDAQAAVRDLYIAALSAVAARALDDLAALGRPHAVSRQLEHSLREAMQQKRLLPHVQFALLDVVATQLNYTNDFERSAALSAEYIELLIEHRADAERVITAYTTLGSTLYQLKRLDACEAARREGVAWAAGTPTWRTERARMRLVAQLGSLLAERGQRREAASLLQRADRVTARDYADGNVRWDVLRAWVLFHRGFDPVAAAEAAQTLLQAIETRLRVPPEDSGAALALLGRELLAAGQFEAAENALRQALPVLAEVYGRDGRRCVQVVGELASALAHQRRFDDARQLLADESARATSATQDPVLSQAQALVVRIRQLEVAALQGDLPAALDFLSPEDGSVATHPGVLEGEALALLEVNALTEAGLGAQALGRLDRFTPEPLDPELPTAQALAWLRARERAERTAGLADAAAGSAAAVQAMVRHARSALPSGA
ncbi:MAG: serine/threonine-protein kinase [Rubrivivax sp.]|nr:serine/threonine-protein kinase [Rubrivivax sp.]